MANRLLSMLSGIADRLDPRSWRAFDFPSPRTDGEPGPAKSGLEITPEGALTITAAYAAVNAISTDVAMLPLNLYRRRPSGSGSDLVRDDPRSELVGLSPDGETTTMRWRQAWVGHSLTQGNGFGEIVFDGNGVIGALYLMSPTSTWATRDVRTGELVYRHRLGYLPPYRVLHLAGLGFDGISGYSPPRLAKEALGLAKATEAHGARFFGKGGRGRGVLKTPQRLNADTFARLRDDWEKKYGNPDDDNKVIILEQGMEYQAITIPPDEAQFLATRQFQVIEVARMYRVPPHKLMDYSQAHLANIEEANLDYLTTTIAPMCEQIEQICDLRLLTRDERLAGLYFKHDMRAFMRGNMVSRSQFYSMGVDKGWFSRDEVRHWEDLNPIGPEAGGSLYTVQAQMVPLDRVRTTDVSIPGQTP